MDAKYAKYMRSGKTVKSKSTGIVYHLVEDMQENEPTVKAVASTSYNDYQMCKAWIRNWDSDMPGFRKRFQENTGSIEDIRAKGTAYEKDIAVSDVEPADKIRFITPDYKDIFHVRDLGAVSVNGKVAHVTYIDATHFTFMDTFAMNVYGGCFHICQFAELCEKEKITLKKISD